MKSIIRAIPNFFTLINAALGMLAIVFAAREEIMMTVWCVALALVVDFLDGFLARLLNAQSELGRELDSLSDMITFGALPGFLMFQLILISRGEYFHAFETWSAETITFASVALLVPMAAGMRLGKFNLDLKSRNHFLGLPVPSMCIVVMSIPLVLEANYHLNFYNPISDATLQILAEERNWLTSDIAIVKTFTSTEFLVFLSLFLSAAMLVRIPMISLKFKGISWAMNKWRFMLIIWAALCYLIFLVPYLNLPVDYGLIDFLIVPIFMAGYFLLSWIYATFEALKKPAASDEI